MARLAYRPVRRGLCGKCRKQRCAAEAFMLNPRRKRARRRRLQRTVCRRGRQSSSQLPVRKLVHRNHRVRLIGPSIVSASHSGTCLRPVNSRAISSE